VCARLGPYYLLKCLPPGAHVRAYFSVCIICRAFVVVCVCVCVSPLTGGLTGRIYHGRVLQRKRPKTPPPPLVRRAQRRIVYDIYYTYRGSLFPGIPKSSNNENGSLRKSYLVYAYVLLLLLLLLYVQKPRPVYRRFARFFPRSS